MFIVNNIHIRVACVCVYPCIPKVTQDPISGPTSEIETPAASQEQPEVRPNPDAGSQAPSQGWRRQGSRFVCNSCKCTRNYQNQIEGHIRDRHWEEEEDGNYCCRYCSFQINTSEKLIEHIQIAHGSEYKCKMCDYKSSHENHLEKHITDNHKSSHQCLVCQLYFKGMEDLAEHMNLTHDKNQEISIKCNHCGKSCTDIEEIKTHIYEDHKTYKPCKKYAAGNCETSKC